jgi:hypothetical protein
MLVRLIWLCAALVYIPARLIVGRRTKRDETRERKS